MEESPRTRLNREFLTVLLVLLHRAFIADNGGAPAGNNKAMYPEWRKYYRRISERPRGGWSMMEEKVRSDRKREPVPIMPHVPPYVADGA